MTFSMTRCKLCRVCRLFLHYRTSVTLYLYFFRTTTRPELSCLSEPASLVRRWRSRTTSPTWWVATASTESRPFECLEERKCSVSECLCPEDQLCWFALLRWRINFPSRSPGSSVSWVDQCWSDPCCVQVGGVPGAKLQRTSLHPGEEGLQQLLWLGQPEQHRGLDAQSPLQLNPSDPQIPVSMTSPSVTFTEHVSFTQTYFTNKWFKTIYLFPIIHIQCQQNITSLTRC